MTRLHIEIEYKIKDMVYVITDPDQNKGIVTAFLIDENSVMYRVCVGSNSNYYYAFELTTEKTIF